MASHSLPEKFYEEEENLTRPLLWETFVKSHCK